MGSIYCNQTAIAPKIAANWFAAFFTIVAEIFLTKKAPKVERELHFFVKNQIFGIRNAEEEAAKKMKDYT